jgi:hypothetical protein
MTVVIGFPNAAIVDANVKDVRLTGDTGCADRSSAAKRSDHAPLHTLELIAAE